MQHHPPVPWVVHPLPPAPHFVGRDAELAALHASWHDGFRGVLALVGLGGAGKTALAARFVDALLAPGAPPRPDGLFVWSFYQRPDAGMFLQEAFQYFGRGAAPPATAKGSGILHLLHEALAMGGPHLLVLDGLERVQRQESTGTYGQIEDPLLKGLLIRIAEGLGHATALVTSRFPLTDLTQWQEQGYRRFDVTGLDPDAARDLLRQHGVRGDDSTLTALIEAYGAHALTLDHLGGLIGQFLDGDARRAPEAPTLADPGSDRQALRLGRLLRAYEQHLPPMELALLCRLCLLRQSVTEAQIGQLFQCSPTVHARTIRELSEQIAQLAFSTGERAPDQEGYAESVDYFSTRQALADRGRLMADAVSRCLEEILCIAPIAGLEDVFRREVLTAATLALELPKRETETEFVELADLYATAEMDVQDDLRPLPAEDRVALRELCARYAELRAHPLLPFQNPLDPALEVAFSELGMKGAERRRRDDLRPDDLLAAYRRVGNRLWHLACKHFILRRVRELGGRHQRKWSLAGPLAPLDAEGLHKVLAGLMGRHLVLCEADGSFNIHPAVRDYFHRLAVSAEQVGWHDLLREQMVTLVQQPGLRLPQDPATLDLVEEGIYHACAAGRADEAAWLFREVLGGMRHLAWKLGETTRGLRILRGFETCPDRDALAWFLRALGELEEAFAIHQMPHFRADIRLLQGRLPEVAREGDPARSATAAFLMGQTRDLPPDLLGCAIPRDQLLLYRGRLGVVRHTASVAALYDGIGWECDRARHQLIQAEVARRQAAPDACRAHLDAAARWILHSGSVEHLCTMHLIETRTASDASEPLAARRAIDAGLHLSQRCGLRLCHIELLCEVV